MHRDQRWRAGAAKGTSAEDLPYSRFRRASVRASQGVAAEGRHRTTLTCGYNCLCVQTAAGLALIDTGLGANFLGYGPEIGQQVGKLGDGLAEAGFTVSEVDAVLFTHLHHNHARGAIWSGELTFPRATAFANGPEVAFWPASAAWADGRPGGGAGSGSHPAVRREVTSDGV